MIRASKEKKAAKKCAGILLTGILFVVMLAGCGEKSGESAGSGQENGRKDSVAAMKEIETALQEQGYTTTYEAVEDGWFSGEGHRMVLNNDLDSQIVLYVYDNAEDAREDMDCIDKTGYHITIARGLTTEQVIVDWVSVPHFYQYQNLLVQYVGLDETVLDVLEEICGECFAGGDLS